MARSPATLPRKNWILDAASNQLKRLCGGMGQAWPRRMYRRIDPSVAWLGSLRSVRMDGGSEASEGKDTMDGSGRRIQTHCSIQSSETWTEPFWRTDDRNSDGTCRREHWNRRGRVGVRQPRHSIAPKYCSACSSPPRPVARNYGMGRRRVERERGERGERRTEFGSVDFRDSRMGREKMGGKAGR